MVSKSQHNLKTLVTLFFTGDDQQLERDVTSDTNITSDCDESSDEQENVLVDVVSDAPSVDKTVVIVSEKQDVIENEDKISVHQNEKPKMVQSGDDDSNGPKLSDALSDDRENVAKNSDDSQSDASSDVLKHRCSHCNFQTSFRGKLSTHLLTKHAELRKEKHKN